MEQRQLKPVLEDLDANRPKQALEQLNKILKRSPRLATNPLSQALRCLCLQRTGQEDEAYEHFQATIKPDDKEKEKEKEKKASGASGNKGKAIARGKGGRAALLKKMQVKGGGEAGAQADETGVEGEKDAEEKKDQEGEVKTIEVQAQEEDVQGKVFEDGVLNVLQFYLRGVGRFRELRKLYLDAWIGGEYKDLEKGGEAFICSVRLRDWEGMQHTSLQLLKLSQDPKMAHWAAMSTYMQAIDRNTDNEAKPLLFSLCHNVLITPPANIYRLPDTMILWLKMCRYAGQHFYEAHKNYSDEQIKKELLEMKEIALKTGFELESEALVALTPDLRKNAQGADFEKSWWAAVGNDLRIRWERWELVGDIAERLIATPADLAQKKLEFWREIRREQKKSASAKKVEEKEEKEADEDDVKDADEQEADAVAETAADAKDTDAGQNNRYLGPLGHIGCLEGWNWEAEWERGDDAIRGVEDVPQTNYKAYQTYISTLFVLLKHPKVIKKSSESPSTYLAKSCETLLDMAANPKFAKKERAPLIALLEINKRLADLKLEAVSVSDEAGTVAILKRYLEEFGHKPCVRDDLKAYLPSLDDGALGSVVEGLLKLMAHARHSTVEEYARVLNGHKLLRCASKPGDKATEEEIGAKYFESYLEGAGYVEDIPDTDVKPADDFAIMAAQAWVRAWFVDQRGEHSRVHLASAIYVLRTVVEASPANAQARMLLMRLYRLIGAPSLVPAHLAPLKMRTFQNDTVLHFITEKASVDYIAGGEKAREAVSSVLLEAKRVYERTEVDVGENTAAAFLKESYSQVPGMFTFGEKFRLSHQRQVAELELIRQSALRDYRELANSDKSVVLQNLSLHSADTAYDNRDWDMFPDFGSNFADTDIVKQTNLGVLSSPESTGGEAAAWTTIISEKPSAESRTSGTSTADFASLLRAFVESCASGTPSSTSAIIESLTGMTTNSNEAVGAEAAVQAVAVLEAFAMLEIAVASFRPKPGKKGKKDTESATTASVRELIEKAQGIVRSYASEFKDREAKDVLLQQGVLAKQMKRLLFEKVDNDDVNATEQDLRNSRVLAAKEVYRELKRRSDG